jgi:hypothetical protein
VSVCDGEDLTGLVHRSLIVLCDNESAPALPKNSFATISAFTLARASPPASRDGVTGRRFKPLGVIFWI